MEEGRLKQKKTNSASGGCPSAVSIESAIDDVLPSATPSHPANLKSDILAKIMLLRRILRGFLKSASPDFRKI
jgi:hypothetical protein